DVQMVERARAQLPELPAARAQRFAAAFGLSAESARLLAFRTELGDFFEAAVASGAEPAPPAQALANWVTGQLVARLQDGGDPGDSNVQPRALAALVGIAASGGVSVGAARRVLDRLIADGGSDPQAIIDAAGLSAIGGGDELAEIVKAALAANADAAERVR